MESADTSSRPTPSTDTRRSKRTIEARRRSASGSQRKREREGSPEGKLARVVDGLRVLEDRMVATVRAAERVVRSSVTESVCREAGFATLSDLEERILQGAPIVRTLGAEVVREPAADVSSTLAEGTSSRRRGVRGLVVIARAIQKIRVLEEKAARDVAAAQSSANEIEANAIYEECGYTSFDDFLVRALGCMAVLSKALTLANEPGPSTPEPIAEDSTSANLAVAEPGLLASDDDAGPFGMATAATPIAADDPAATAPSSAPAAASPAKSPRAASGRGLKPVVLTVVLGLIAAVIGAGAGLFNRPLTGAVVSGPDASVVEPAAPR